ncbi:hypothetical protein [Raineya sp.]|jgi:threonine dehydrogenase-like Zn-dependent dehydrogenase
MQIEQKTYILEAPKKLILKTDFIDTDKLSPKQIVAQTLFSAISTGTELAAYLGVEPLREGKAYPRLLGYCNLAKVVHKGKDINNIEIGDFILTFQSHRNSFVLNENDFFILLKNIDEASVQKFTFAYLYHLGYHALLTASAKAGHNVGIIGMGTLGYTTATMACLASCNVFVFSNQSDITFPNVQVFPKNIESLDKINLETNNIGLDIVINTSNTWEDWKLAIKLVNKGGTIVNLGFPGRGQDLPQFNPLDPKELYVKSVTIKYLSVLDENSLPYYHQRFNIERNLQYIIRLIKTGKINVEEICSEKISYDKLENQYEKYAEQRTKQMYSTLLIW